MNFLAHAYLGDGDDDLVLGGLMGDFIRGRLALHRFTPGLRRGIRLHRRIDRFTDHDRTVKQLRRGFPKEFRRYAGIVIDVAFDHELARHWSRFSDETIEQFDIRIRTLLSKNEQLLPGGLVSFMRYADVRGLFAGYRNEDEMLYSLSGVGTRLKRANPLHRVGEIWPDIREEIGVGFEDFFPRLRTQVDHWVNRRSTMTGS